VKTAIERHDGRTRIIDGALGGACFEVLLPVELDLLPDDSYPDDSYPDDLHLDPTGQEGEADSAGGNPAAPGGAGGDGRPPNAGPLTPSAVEFERVADSATTTDAAASDNPGPGEAVTAS
jgi:hypothetical protein